MRNLLFSPLYSFFYPFYFPFSSRLSAYFGKYIFLPLAYNGLHNIYPWPRVERYREAAPKKREREAWKIYRTYISIGAPHELNLDILSRKVGKKLLNELVCGSLNFSP